VTGRQRVSVRCEPAGEGWRCDVTVGDDAGATRHDVGVPAGDLARLAPGHDDPEALVRTAFAFLLEREPREAILRRFDVAVIERYFPGAEAEIRRRLGGA
jgi:hypothetical protein